MKIKIGLILLFVGICGLNAYAVSDDDQHMRAVNQQLDEIERVYPSRTVTQMPQASTFFNGRVHAFSIDTQTFYSHYSEPQKTRTVTGVWGGVEGKYTFRPPQGNFLNTPVINYYAIEGLYASGKNDLSENEQRPSDNSITKLNIKDIPGYMFESRFLLGRDFIPLSSVRLTPYTGFGIRYKTDQSAEHYNVFDNYLGSPVVAIGYDFSDLYYYIPTGLTLDLAANNGYEVSMNMEYDYLVKGYERDDYSDFDQYTLPADGFTNQNLRYSLNHGWGYRSSLKLLKHFTMMDVYLEPYLRYWHINASKLASGSVGGGDYLATANKNSTIEIGSSLGLIF